MIRTFFTVGLGSLLIVYAVILSFTESFAWYRIVFGLLILATWQLGFVDWSSVGD